MRLRHDPRADVAVVESRYVVNEPESQKGRWHELFGNDSPVHIEIGMGKGRFITTLAKENPGINYIGIERVATVLYKALKRQAEPEMGNLLFLNINATEIDKVFDRDEVEKIYLNFSDPWPKDRHSQRRLTSPYFLKLYDSFLAKDGVIEFKTDNRGLFDYSIDAALSAGWKVKDITYDLHNSGYKEGNIMTEYEMRFLAEGVPINRLVLYR